MPARPPPPTNGHPGNQPAQPLTRLHQVRLQVLQRHGALGQRLQLVQRAGASHLQGTVRRAPPHQAGPRAQGSAGISCTSSGDVTGCRGSGVQGGGRAAPAAAWEACLQRVHLWRQVDRQLPSGCLQLGFSFLRVPNPRHVSAQQGVPFPHHHATMQPRVKQARGRSLRTCKPACVAAGGAANGTQQPPGSATHRKLGGHILRLLPPASTLRQRAGPAGTVLPPIDGRVGRRACGQRQATLLGCLTGRPPRAR